MVLKNAHNLGLKTKGKKKNSWFDEHAHLKSTFLGEPCKKPNKSIAIYLIIFSLIINLVCICETFLQTIYCTGKTVLV
jgi:hypothetical protein